MVDKARGAGPKSRTSTHLSIHPQSIRLSIRQSVSATSLTAMTTSPTMETQTILAHTLRGHCHGGKAWQQELKVVGHIVTVEGTLNYGKDCCTKPA